MHTCQTGGTYQCFCNIRNIVSIIRLSIVQLKIMISYLDFNLGLEPLWYFPCKLSATITVFIFIIINCGIFFLLLIFIRGTRPNNKQFMKIHELTLKRKKKQSVKYNYINLSCPPEIKDSLPEQWKSTNAEID